jgi:hypothetical protein
MKHDIFEFCISEMRWYAIAWRVALVLFCIGVLAYDLLVGRPG